MKTSPRSIHRVLAAAMTAAAAILFAVPASAQSAAEFYRGKTVTLGIPSTAGGGYDEYVRVLGRHFGKHLAGNPAMLPQNVPAGGGLVLVNNLYNAVPKDGTYIGLVRPSALYEELFGNAAASFKGREFTWLGNLNSDHDTCVFWHSSGVQSPADFYSREILLGATGAGAMSFSFPRVYNDVLGTKFKIVSGYGGTPDRMLAMERGELHGACGLTTATFKATLAQPYKEGKLKLIAQAGINKDPDFPDTPNILDEAKTAEQRQALEFLFAQMEINRAMAAPPGVPAERAKALRDAFEATMKDKEFLADAEKVKLDVDWMGAEATAKTVERLYASPKPVIDKLRAALATGAK